MTNEQCNALTAAIITGFNTLARATALAASIQGKSNTSYDTLSFTAPPESYVLPIEPTAPVEAKPVDDDIAPGKGYRWMEIHETLEGGDQIFYSGDWQLTCCAGATVKESLAGTADNRTYRRKVEPATDNEPRRMEQFPPVDEVAP